MRINNAAVWVTGRDMLLKLPWFLVFHMFCSVYVENRKNKSEIVHYSTKGNNGGSEALSTLQPAFRTIILHELQKEKLAYSLDVITFLRVGWKVPAKNYP